jgi:hypothetical protein
MRKNDQEGATIDPARVSEVIAMTRVWLDIGVAGRLRRLPELAPESVLHALQAGERVRWRGWTLRTLPPRRFGLPMGESAWAAGIMAVSALGLFSELRVDSECVLRLCQRIEAVESRLAQDPLDGVHGQTEWELEDC